MDLGAEPITIKFFSLLLELYYNIAFVRIHDRTVRLIPDKFSIGSMFGLTKNKKMNGCTVIFA